MQAVPKVIKLEFNAIRTTYWNYLFNDIAFFINYMVLTLKILGYMCIYVYVKQY